jgi:hypothetical protein
MQIYKVNRKNVYAIRGDAYQPLYMCTFFLFVYTGTAGADPGGIGKNIIFLARNTPKFLFALERVRIGTSLKWYELTSYQRNTANGQKYWILPISPVS